MNSTSAKSARRCPGQIVADQAGRSIEEICRLVGTRREGLNRDYFLRLCRRGGAGPYLAKRLAQVCNCSCMVFMHGYEARQQYNELRHTNVLQHPTRALRGTEPLAGPGALSASPNR